MTQSHSVEAEAYRQLNIDNKRHPLLLHSVLSNEFDDEII